MEKTQSLREIRDFGLRRRTRHVLENISVPWIVLSFVIEFIDAFDATTMGPIHIHLSRETKIAARYSIQTLLCNNRKINPAFKTTQN